MHNLVSAEEIDDLVRLATARGGFGRSPLKAQGSGESLSKDERRNSSSCPMLWPLGYEGKEEQIRQAAPERAAALLEELSLVTRLSTRVAELFSATGMPLSARHIEPLQLVRYKAGELFGPHHDYHATGESSVQGEQRVMTVLVFGSTLAPEDGGETDFPHLGVSVSPRAGDAVAWMNVDMEGEPEDRSPHQGKPPLRGEKVAINVWVADQPFDVGNMGSAVRT